ncbi:MAG: DEAD/DEAH box helicase [Spirochaetaceae bacterium]|nr:DEAD/DEAH box helicase [Spirochaetaceae bacterium]
MDKPLIVQSDLTLMLDVHNTLFDEARVAIGRFAELEKAPEHFHLYRISALSLWNAAALGLTSSEIVDSLQNYSRYELPANVAVQIADLYSRYGRLILLPQNDGRLLLTIANPKDKLLLRELASHKQLVKYLMTSDEGFSLKLIDRGTIKQLLIKVGWPVKDLVPLRPGSPFAVTLQETLQLRPYQVASTNNFLGDGKVGYGFGVIVLPCGAGKTVVGIDVMSKVQNETLILAANIAAARQWKREILAKTYVKPEDIGEYSGDFKEIKPITIATYQIMVWRKDKEAEFEHFKLFSSRNWGLIIYDEAHLLPAPVFRITAEIQSVHRLGLTATLVREDGAESDVFSLIGPKRYDVAWRDLEKQGYIATANCIEVKVALTAEEELKYATASPRAKMRIASEGEAKLAIVNKLLSKHEGESILIIGQYLNQLNLVAGNLKAPIITGQTPNGERDRIYDDFREGKIKVLVVSKVANFSIDLPDASVAIQLSGTFGSRQEEAQRLGRIIRPKDRPSYFYSVVSRFTEEELFSANRQKFLAEQGYSYAIYKE